ncbi:uncharacterized protein LOC128264801 [Drosophila gunungcola]|uniref:Corticotropin-releasing factor domain-containing protein n=1 Tax=Drosophila gunungcola TaxID=103775 RepID=A0A9P9YZE6_9MUSC|nr:uncharacterized protein LOC128264801 [Drosophila gunungcola]KAI8045909.1 hypothetical protein M5D96_002098 [Drosophila gunungcola]
MMKATAWFGPVLLTLLCATRLVCTAQRGGAGGGSGGGAEVGGSGRTNGYPLDYPDARNSQDDFLLAKRNKPSLSIVNPLDVLRQRLLLEIARRQMKENSRQVELNRAILKNVGKRYLLRGAEAGAGAGAPQVSWRYRQQWPVERELQLQLERERERETERERDEEPEEQLGRQQLLPWKHFPSQLWSYGWSQSQSPSSQFSDSLQSTSTRPQSQALPGQKLLSYAKNSLDVAGMGLARHRVNGNEANETNHEHENGNGNENENENDDGSKNPARYVDDDDENDNDVGPEGVGVGVGVGLGLGLGLGQGLGLGLGLERFDVFEDKPNWANEEPNEVVRGAANANDRLPWPFPYRFHKSQHNVN